MLDWRGYELNGTDRGEADGILSEVRGEQAGKHVPEQPDHHREGAGERAGVRRT